MIIKQYLMRSFDAGFSDVPVFELSRLRDLGVHGQGLLAAEKSADRRARRLLTSLTATDFGAKNTFEPHQEITPWYTIHCQHKAHAR